jgi:hypothetical protein
MSLLVALLLAQVSLADEGGPRKVVNHIDCVGAGITCSATSTFGTITVSGGGGGGGAPTTAKYILQEPDATLSAEQALSTLGSGLLLNTTGTGVLTVYTGASCTNQFIRSLTAAGVATCASIALAADVSGILPVANGGTGAAPGAADQVLVSTSTSAATWRTLPSCSNATTSKLLYDSSTDTFSCGTDQTGGGGSANFVADAFGFSDSSDALKTVTAAWATTSSSIVCAPLGEEESVEDLRVTVVARASGSFTARGYVPVGRHTGTMNFRCTGD